MRNKSYYLKSIFSNISLVIFVCAQDIHNDYLVKMGFKNKGIT